MSEVMKIGFIGAGGIARAHLRRLASIPEARVVAVCDLNEERAREAAATFNANVYTDYHEMVLKEKLDAVWVCIPPFAHSDEVSLCAENGIHVFIEKPIALTIEKAREMQHAAEKHGIKTWVGYHWRQKEVVRLVKKLLIEEGGQIGLLTGYWWGGVPGAPWWRRKEMSGGQVVEQTTHIFDLARFLAGEVEKVYAEYNTLLNKDLENFNIEDVSVVTLRFRNGAVGVITSTSAAKKGGDLVGLRLVAKNLQAEIFGKNARILTGFKTMEVSSTEDPYLIEDHKFVKAVLEDLPCEVPISEGLKTLEVTLAAVKSAETGRPVMLPLP